MRLSKPALAVCLLCASPGAAHIVIANPQGDAGSSSAAAFRVSHGCGDSPTVSIRIQIPPAVTNAKPQPKPGWIMRVERAPLAKPIASESGLARAERIAAVTWLGRLDPDQFDEFRILLNLPETAGALYFPTLQRCEQGEAAWTNIPARGQAWSDVKQPAPVLIVQKAAPAPAQKR